MFWSNWEYPNDDGGYSSIQEPVGHSAIEYLQPIPQHGVVEAPAEIDDRDQQHVNLPVPEDSDVVYHDQQDYETGHTAFNSDFEGKLIGSGELIENRVPKSAKQQITLKSEREGQ